MTLGEHSLGEAALGGGGSIPSAEQFGTPIVRKIGIATETDAALPFIVQKVPPIRVEVIGGEVTPRFEPAELEQVDTAWMARVGLVLGAAGFGAVVGSHWGLGMQLWLIIVAGLDMYVQIERDNP